MDNEDDRYLTIAEAGYEWEDWLPVFQEFENRENIKPDYPEADVRDILEDNGEAVQEAGIQFTVEDTNTKLEFRYGSERRKENQLLTEGWLSFYPDFEANTLDSKRTEIATEHAQGYFKPLEANPSYGKIQIPESYSQELLEEAIDASLQTATDLQELENELHSTVKRF